MTRLASLGLALALAGCATPSEESATPLVMDASALSIEQSENLTSGSYDDGSTSVDFRSELVAPTVLDIEMEFNDLMITVTVDWDTGVIEHDGFTVADGSATQFTDADRATMTVFAKALDTLGTDVDGPTEHLRNVASTWSEYPTTVDLRGQKLVDPDRSYTSICNTENTYQAVTHDDWDYDRWEDASTYNAWISFDGPGPCSDETYFWTGSAWSCYEPDHSTSVEYAYGDCFGRCGGGCGSGTQLTWDCADHDSCVRFGHSTASFWCNDEFSSTLDDALAAPNCH